MLHSLLIFAAVEDVIRAMIPILVIVIWIASQIMGREKRPVVQPPRREPAGDGVGGQAAQANQEAAQADLSIREQVEQFLRQAAEHRDRANQRPREMAAPEPTAQAAVESRPVAESSRAPRQDLTENSSKVPEGLKGRKLKSRLRTSLSQSSEHLGEGPGQADEKLAEHLHKKFDHSVGRLAQSSQEQQSPASQAREESPAASIAAALRDPTNVRRAFIYGEIFNRPADRW